GNDRAGFVQVMRGRVTNPEKLAALEHRKGEIETALGQARPDVLGDVMVVTGDGSYLEAIYFTSEADARRGEAGELPADMAALMDEFMSAVAIDEYLDLKDPWLHWPRARATVGGRGRAVRLRQRLGAGAPSADAPRGALRPH